MSEQTTSEPFRSQVRGDGVSALLDTVCGMVAVLGRDDLAGQLDQARDRLSGSTCHVLVVGEFSQGKSALVNALVGLPACGVSASVATSVTTVLKYGQTLSAVLVGAEVGAEVGAAQERVGVSLPQAAQAALDGTDPAGRPITTVEVSAPRELLRSGLVLVDTPGVGGGLGAARAAVTMRALSMADALLFVTDAGQELTASEVEFLRRGLELCPVAVCAVTKIDLYPDWQRILELDREQLRRAGLEIDVVPLSAPLRELALSTGDPALWAESGYPVLSRLLDQRVPARRRAQERRRVVQTAGVVLGSLGDQLGTEQAMLDDPAGQSERLAGLQEAQAHAQRITGAGSRWQHCLADQVRIAGRSTTDDLDERLTRVRRAAQDRIAEADPATAWSQIEPWLIAMTNDELLAHHRDLLRQVAALVTAVAAEFDLAAADLPTGSWLTGAGARPAMPPVERLSVKPASLLDLGMTAARGFSLSSSVVGAVLFTLLAPLASPGLLISIPVLAGLGSLFAYRSVRSGRDAQVRQARAEATRLVAGYLEHGRVATWRADEDVIDRVRRAVRDHFAEQAGYLVASAAANLRAADDASRLRTDGVQSRQVLLQARAVTVRKLAAALDAALASTGAVS